MIEKAKNRTLPLVLTILLALVLVASGLSVLGVQYAQASTSDTTSASQENETLDTADGMTENANTSATTYTYNYTGNQQSVTLGVGKWKLEVWGAAGGNGSVKAGGLGGYARGTINLTANTTLYIYVGQQPTSTAGGWNGGGAAKGSTGRGGGGGTDIRIGGTSLYYRVIVAGGGGGGHSDSAYNAGAGGGSVGGDGAHVGSNGNHGSVPKGGTQSAGGAQGVRSGSVGSILPTAGTFGQGGAGGYVSNYGGGGGGGWYGGGGGTGGSSCSQGGAGGSGYVATTSSYKPSGYAVNSAYYLTDTNFTGSQSGHGKVVITQVNNPPTQTSIPTFALNRASVNASIALQGTTAGTLFGKDTDPNNGIKICTAGIYTAASTAATYAANAANNAWISYTANAGATSITNLKATRYWSGTKTFYVYVKDYLTTTSADQGGYSWFSFYATCAAGTVSAGAGTPKVNGANMAAANFKYGQANTNIANNASSGIFNPTGNGNANLYTLWLKEPLSPTSDVEINVGNLFTTNLGSYEKMSISSSVTYDTLRYASSSATAASGVAIPGCTNSSGCTSVTFSNAVTTNYHNGTTTVSNYTNGYSTVKLRAKAGVVFGQYYYRIRLTVNQLCNQGGTAESTKYVDIIYRLDNTRPYFAGGRYGTSTMFNPSTGEPNLTVATGGTTSISLSSICSDPDNNALTIQQVVVPTGEYIATDKYKHLRLLSATTKYNYGYTSAAEGSDVNITNIETTAQSTVSTGFNASFAFKTTGSGADSSFPAQSGQGSADNAYIGYYVNTARNTLTIVGNKASRNSYDQKTNSNGQTRFGHFYILIRVADAGDASDAGIWYPIAITVTSAAPISAGTPQISGAVGSTHYFTPLGYLYSGSYYGIGTYDSGDVTSFINHASAQNGRDTSVANATSRVNVEPLSYDIDNFQSQQGTTSKSLTVGSTPVTTSATTNSRATWSQREMQFLSANSVSITVNGVAINNANLAASGTNVGTKNNVTDYQQGYKEFFTVEKVPLYARTSILYGLTQTEITALANAGTIAIEKPAGYSGNDQFVRFYGLKVTLNKYTMGKYLSFYVNVTDTYGSSTAVRVAVNVANQALSTASIRNNDDDNASVASTLANNFDPRKTTDHKDGTVVRTTSGSGEIVLEYTLRIGEELRLSPYDVFYNADTYTVNTLNADGSIKAYNTTPYSTGHSDMITGINKTMYVFSADTATATPTKVTNFAMKKLTVAAANRITIRQALGGDLYCEEFQYVAESAGNYAEHYYIKAGSKTPSSGYVSFNYIVTSSAGVSASVEIRIRVENSLPILQDQAKDTNDASGSILMWLSANPSPDYVNSSSVETKVSESANYFRLVNGENTKYSVREFTLADLFYDPDGDTVRFYSVNEGIEVGTHNVNGEFVKFENDENVFINVYIGSGSNNRSGYNNCLIVEALSSTQGIPGGLWIRFKVSDNAIGTTGYYEYEFQVEVVNTAPIYEDLTGTNNMDANRPEDAKLSGDYTWTSESERTSNVVANAFRDTAVTNTSNAAITSVYKPLYIASNAKAMDYYYTAVRGTTRGANFSYSTSQVRYLAKDPDSAQGLALYSNGYAGQTSSWDAPSFQIIETQKDSTFDPSTVFKSGFAVALDPMYSGWTNRELYLDRNMVQIIFFDDEGIRLITDAKESVEGAKYTRDQANALANTTTNWVIAFNFLDELPTNFTVYLRLRDGNSEVIMPAGVQKATAGGHTLTASNAFRGRRSTATNAKGEKEFDGKTPITDTHNVFSFTVNVKSQGLINNFTKWSTTDKKTVGGVTYDLDNTWRAKDTDGVEYTYADRYTVTGGNAGLFRYDGITVAAGDTATVPISYFAWPADNMTEGSRNKPSSAEDSKGSPQTRVAFYDVAENLFGTAASSFSAIRSAISISDGRYTWADTNLEKNPYLNFGLISLDSLNSVNDVYVGSTSYLYDQQRFAVSGSGTSITNVDLSPTGVTGQYFLEDLFGLSLSKKSIRSVGNLTLSVKIALWQYNDSSNSYRWAYDSTTKEKVTITVNVPVFVGNTVLTLQNDAAVAGTDKEYYVKTSTASTSGIVVPLLINGEDATKYGTNRKTINVQAADQADSASIYYTSAVYREDAYFLASSLDGSFSQSELAYLYKGTNTLVDGVGTRLTGYFGGKDNHTAIVRKTVNDGTQYELAEGVLGKINPGYSDFFSVSLTGMDSKSITITPKRLTTFTYDSTKQSREEIEQAAAKLGLKVQFSDNSTSKTVNYIYYPLKLIVYDRLTVGANSTTFDTSSYEVVTIRVHIENTAPTLVTRNLTEASITIPGFAATRGRTITLTKGQSVTYNFADFFSDADMEINPYTNSYYTQAEISGDANDPNALITTTVGNNVVKKTLYELIYDEKLAEYNNDEAKAQAYVESYKELLQNTSDYPKVDSETGRVVSMQFIANEIRDVTPVTQYDAKSNPGGAISYNVETNGNITVTVHNRAFGYKPGDVAAYIRITFADRFNGVNNKSTAVSTVIAVRIGNEAPTLSSDAAQVTEITMHTGDYFTLYTTEYDKFIAGVGSGTVGLNTVSGYNGTYFTDNSFDSTKFTNPSINKWSYADLNSIAIGIDSYMDSTGSTTSHNLGYMAIADDDAPWTLRLDDYASGGRGPVSVSNSAMISHTLLNRTPYDGGKGTTYYAYTAVMFQAVGVCSDVTVSVTLTDGVQNLDDGAQRSLVYTFRINVVSTAPEAVTTQAEGLGESLPANWKSRLSYNNGEYELKMYSGEEVTLKTSDFASDIDQGDESLLYLLRNGNDSPFLVTSSEVEGSRYTDSTQHMQLTYRSATTVGATRSTQFTVKALNFHNEGASDGSLSDLMEFYIADPYYDGADAKYLVPIKLRVRVYPQSPNAVTANATDVKIISVADYETSGEAYAVKLVTMPGEGGLIEDKDAFTTRVRYSVKLYTLTYYTAENSITSYMPQNFATLRERDDQMIAEFTINAVEGAGEKAPTLTIFDASHKNAATLKDYIKDIFFSEDGSVMYIVPNKATNTFNQILGGTLAQPGFYLYAEVSKYIERGTSDYGPGVTAQPSYSAGAYMKVTIGNSAPVPVGVTPNNTGLNKGYPYTTFVGERNDSCNLFLYNNLTTKDEALFSDADGDALTYVDNPTVKEVYTLNITGEKVLHTNKAGVLTTATNAIRVTGINLTYKYPVGTSGEGEEAETMYAETTYAGINVTIINKINITGYEGQRVYLTVVITAKDASESANTELTIGIDNGAPVLKTDKEIAAKYTTKGNSYEYNESTGEATLTLTLTKDDNAAYASVNGSITVPLTDLLYDKDYNSDPSRNTESFTFVKGQNSRYIYLSDISGHAERTQWVEKGLGGYSTTTSEIANRRFHIRVSNNSNAALIFKVNSFERGATDEVVLLVSDSSGATTAALTIRLVIGNSAPKLVERESNRLIIEGGIEGTGNNGTFESTVYSLLDFVTDNNPADTVDYHGGAPATPTTYMRIVAVEQGAIIFDKQSDFTDYLFADASFTEPLELFELITYEQSIVITPFKKLYGRQMITITACDDGTVEAEDAQQIVFTIEVQISKSLSQMEISDFHVFWKKTETVTASALFGEDSEGLTITKLEVKQDADKSISLSQKDSVYSIRGDLRVGEDKQPVLVTASVIVGDSGVEKTKDFRVFVDNNEQPDYRQNDTGATYGTETVTYVGKGTFNDDGLWEVPLTQFFLDKEGDAMQLVSATSNKGAIIDVTADKQTNKLVFRFKYSGDVVVHIKLKDAVAEYDYDIAIGTYDLNEPNFFVVIIARVQEQPMIFLIALAALLLLILLIIIIIVAVRKKRKMREEIEALLVNEMELEEQMLRLAAGPSPTNYQAYGYLPPTPAAQQNPGLMLGSGASTPAPNSGAIGLNPGVANTNNATAAPQLPPSNDGFSDDDL